MKNFNLMFKNKVFWSSKSFIFVLSVLSAIPFSFAASVSNNIEKDIKIDYTIPEQRQISGTVTDTDGVPLPGATVRVKGTNVGAITNFDGNFDLTIPGDEDILVVSFIGFVTKEITLNDETVINIVLRADAAALDEIVVIGYGTLSKKRVTGSVSSISPEQIVDMPVASVENAIIGQVAGVQVQQVSGEPGSSPNIKIRGSGSISAGGDPLFVVDGIPISKNLTSVDIQGDLARRGGSFQAPPVNPLATINPNDIVSIEILKDASSTAIYGSRGGNGVVLITTKNGTPSEEGVFNFNSFYSSQKVANKLDLMNSEELIAYTRDARNNPYVQDVPGASADDPIGPGERGNGNYEIPESFLNWDGTDTDWQDLIFRTGSMQSYNLSYASPMQNNTSYYVSGGYFTQEGIVPDSQFDRYTLMLNLDSQLSDKLNLDLRIAPSITENQREPASAPYFARPPGIVYSALVHSPTVKPYNEDGSINQTNNQSHLGAGTTTASNPLAIIPAIDDNLFQFQTRTSLGLSYDITPDLTFKTFGGSYINIYNRDFYRANSLLYRNSTEGESYAQASSSTQNSWLWENTINWTKEQDDHFVDAIVGYSMQKDNVSVKQVQADNFPDDLVTTLSGGQVFAGSSLKEQWSLLSAFFRVNYSYQDKYLFTGTIRSDKSSRFGANNQTGYFPSFSAGWRVNEEDFLSSVDAVSELKLKFSWGQTGNFEIPNYGAIGLLSPLNYNFNGSQVNGLLQSTIRNPELTWEKATQTNFGVELGLFNNRLFLLADYYRTVNSDLLLFVGIPSVSGFETTLQNIGEVENKGFEVALRTRNIVGDFTWETNLNFSANKNEVLALNANNEPIFSRGSAGIRHITRVGDPIGSYFGYVVDGIYQSQEDIANSPEDTEAPDPAPGDFKFLDVNGDGKITPDDRTVTGSYFPDFTWGITNTFTYKNIDFSFLIQGVEGNEILNLTSRHLKNGEANFNSYAVFNERWRSPSEPGNGNIPRADRESGSHGNNNRPSSFQVEDGSFIRLRNVTIGYSLDTQDTFLGETFDRFRVYLTAINLATLTDYLGYNPEVSNNTTSSLTPGEDYGTYPLTTSLTLGFNLNF
jgi:TonB-linked SusC/RagA family outer membrane protein